MKFRKSLLLALLPLFLASLSLRAEDPQPTTGTITGSVVDSDGKPVANAQIKALVHVEPKVPPKKGKNATDPTTAPAFVATSDAKGGFSIKNVPPNTYDVMAVSKNGKGRGRAANSITVKVGDVADVGVITLKPHQ